MKRNNTNLFLNFLNGHIRKVKEDAENLANLKVVDLKTIKRVFHLTEMKTFEILKQLAESNVVEWIVESNNLKVKINSKEHFVNYICSRRRFETQVMYLNLSGNVSVDTIQEVFQISKMNALIIFSKLLSNAGCLDNKSNNSCIVRNIEKSLMQIGGSMNFYSARYAS